MRQAFRDRTYSEKGSLKVKMQHPIWDKTKKNSDKANDVAF